MYYKTADKELVDVGTVKIGQFNMEKGQRRPSLPESFEHLEEQFFSLGQRKSYYQELSELDLSETVLVALNDIANDNALFRKAREEDVSQVSLLRSVKETTVLGEFSRIISGAAPLTAYDFRYVGPKQLSAKHEPIELDFKVTPESDPPSNIHVLIGRNGIGKSFILNAMVRALVTDDSDPSECGVFHDEYLPGIENNLALLRFVE